MQHIHSNSVTIDAPARLHMGFLDLNGSLGRKYGSLGLALDNLSTKITAYPSSRICVEGPQSSRVESFAHQSLQEMGIDSGVHIKVHQAIPGHSGLGSGTQLALAVGTAISKLYGQVWPLSDMAKAMHRGERSGIGIGIFEQGGFIIDGGRNEQRMRPSSVVSRLDFPGQWRVILVIDQTKIGIHGEQEKKAFAELDNFSEESAGRLCRYALMQAIPSLVEKDIENFGTAISYIQEIVGDHFAPAQGGRFASPLVADILNTLRQNGAFGIGQSSWGPTGFALAESEDQADRLIEVARSEFNIDGIDFLICSGRNFGADIQINHYTSLARSK